MHILSALKYPEFLIPVISVPISVYQWFLRYFLCVLCVLCG